LWNSLRTNLFDGVLGMNSSPIADPAPVDLAPVAIAMPPVLITPAFITPMLWR
jgi:hypothetical protein